jgi:hypothetical protein
MNKLLKILWIVISNLRLYSQPISRSIVRIRTHGQEEELRMSFSATNSIPVIDAEAVGRVDALGPGVEEWRVGQRVGIGFH